MTEATASTAANRSLFAENRLFQLLNLSQEPSSTPSTHTRNLHRHHLSSLRLRFSLLVCGPLGTMTVRNKLQTALQSYFTNARVA